MVITGILQWDENILIGKQKNLPTPTKEIKQIRKDFKRWGYALIEDGMSKDQCEAFIERLLSKPKAKS